MCNSWCIDLARTVRSQLGELGRVLEVGARQVNGGVRDQLEPASSSYFGVDLEEGPGVDRVLSVYDLHELEEREFDLVVSTEMLEHCEDWREALWQMVSLLRPGGHLFLTTRTPGFALHGYPDDWWRFTPRDLVRALEPAAPVVQREDDLTLDWACGVGVIAQRSEGDLDAWRTHLAGIEVAPVDRSRGEGIHHPPIELAEEVRADLEQAARLLARHRSSPQARWYLARRGFHLSPTGPRSAIAGYDELQASFEHLETRTDTPVAALFEREAQVTLLDELAPLAAEFEAPEQGRASEEFVWSNSDFSRSDALVYYALLRRLAPRRVLQVGARSAAFVARAALDRNGHGELVTLADEDEQVPPGSDRVLRRRGGIAAWQADEFAAELEDGDVLFLDTSHVVKSGSDCARLYLELLPGLERRLWVQVHDVYLPRPYPRRWVEQQGLEWNEQYVLAAWLLDHPSWRVRLGSEFLRQQAPGALKALGGPAIGGGSLWIERIPAGDE